MKQFFQITTTVITLGCLYALMALAWNVVFAVTGVLNLAQGEFFMLGGIVVAAQARSGTSLAIAVAMGLVLPLVVALVTEAALLSPLARRGKIFLEVIVTLALAILLREIVAWIVGPDPIFGPRLITGGTINIFGAFVPRQAILMWVVTVVLGLALWYLFSRTTLGSALRAGAENPEGALLIGLPIAKLRLFALGLAGLLGGIAGVVMSALTPIGFNTGTFVGLKGFVAAAFGGLGFLGGGIAGSVFLAALEGYFSGYVSDAYRDVLVFGVLIVILLLRPTGLMAAGRGRRPRRARPATAPPGLVGAGKGGA